MKLFLIITLGLHAASQRVCAQRSTDWNEGGTARLVITSGTHHWSWWEKPGRTYFMQSSISLSGPWIYLPTVKRGTGGIVNGIGCSVSGLESQSPGFYTRLIYSDFPTTCQADAEQFDFENDGVGNLEELNQGTDPLGFVDADHDGMPDAWEIKFFGSIPSREGNQDFDNDGMPDRFEFTYRLNPIDAADAGIDSDKDGSSNREEMKQGRNPRRKDHPAVKLRVLGSVFP